MLESLAALALSNRRLTGPLVQNLLLAIGVHQRTSGPIRRCVGALQSRIEGLSGLVHTSTSCSEGKRLRNADLRSLGETLLKKP